MQHKATLLTAVKFASWLSFNASGLRFSEAEALKTTLCRIIKDVYLCVFFKKVLAQFPVLVWFEAQKVFSKHSSAEIMSCWSSYCIWGVTIGKYFW